LTDFGEFLKQKQGQGQVKVFVEKKKQGPSSSKG
jgi:hypothetical protein